MSERAGSSESLQQRLVVLQQEALVLAHDLLEQLGQAPAVSSVAEMVTRWEQIEAIVGALKMSQAVLAEKESEEIKQGARQLRRWRREQGKKGNVGWIEIRTVKGFGPYVYYRSREAEEETTQGEDTKKKKTRTEYYGRLDLLEERYGLRENLYGIDQPEA